VYGVPRWELLERGAGNQRVDVCRMPCRELPGRWGGAVRPVSGGELLWNGCADVHGVPRWELFERGEGNQRVDVCHLPCRELPGCWCGGVRTVSEGELLWGGRGDMHTMSRHNNDSRARQRGLCRLHVRYGGVVH
jgi:hypothetical protein